MKDISKVPNSVLKALEPFLKTKSELFHLKKDDVVFLNFVGLNDLSDCYFRVTEYHLEAGKFLVSITQKPQNEHQINERIYRTPIDSINAHLEKWKGFLSERKRLYEIFNSSERFKEIEEEFFNSSPYNDSEFENDYFSIHEANQLSEVCVKLIEYIEKESSIVNKEELLEEVKLLEINAIQESKRKLSQRFSKIKALLIKNGPKTLKILLDIGVNVTGNVISKMIAG